MREQRFSNDKDADFYYTNKPYYEDIDKPQTLSRLQEIVATGFVALLVAIGIIMGIVWATKVIQLNQYELEESKKINDQYKELYKSVSNIDEHLITKAEIENLKKVYEKEEREKQKANLLKAETKLGKELCPIGSFVRLKETDMIVRVNDIFGLEAMTWEMINFDISKINDEWEFSDVEHYYIQCLAQNRIPYTATMINKIVG